MLHTAMLAAALLANPQSSPPRKTSIQQCFETMNGAVYHGDPSDKLMMKRNVVTCMKSIDELSAMRPVNPTQGPQKLFVTGRVLDRSATLSYMGLGDWVTALREVKRANLYFRIAAGLTNQTAEYHDAALANVQLTRLQLQTLDAERTVALRSHGHVHTMTAYHKL